MDYRHLTAEELVRHIGAQVGNDLELEGELVRRVVAGEVVLTATSALEEKQEEIDELREQVTDLEATIVKLQAKIDSANETLLAE